jgi:rubredoxin
MEQQVDRNCPDCGTPMKFGYLGPVGLIRWFDEYRYSFTTFEMMFFAKKVCKAKWPKNQQAYRCLNCGLVIFQGKPIQMEP